MTLKCIAGILTPDEGKIVFNGVTLFDSAARINLPPQRRRVGYLFQQYALFPHMTVEQNIASAISGRSRRKETTARLLSRFRLEQAAKQRPDRLSGGQQQRVALARILASEPKVLLLDEPFSAMDSFLQYELETELAEVLETFPGPVVWVSHDRGEVFRNCRRVCILDRGRSQGIQDLEKLFHNPGTEAAARLSGCKNYADVRQEGSKLFFPQWNLTLECGRTVPQQVRRAGVRAHHIRPAVPESLNAFPCRVVRVVEDVFSTIVLLMPENAADSAPVLRMEMEKDAWQAVNDKQKLTVAIEPENIMLLREEVL